MAKPIGVVAMLFLLLSSGPALAGEKLFTKRIDIWAVTHNGELYLETKRGNKYIAPMENCAVSTIMNFQDPDIFMRGRFLHEGSTVRIYDAGNKLKNSNVRCKLGKVFQLT